ncbi:hypothetical protein ABZ804_21820 [Streptomyces sp. NPDC047726]|uniref:hypothetical protein n=1 Tax=unclassified Streptomyces TaxID=2593676 RepID=UPI0033F3A974
MPAHPTALAAAHRARTIATIARTRAAWPVMENNEKGRAATQIAELLDTAAHSLETEEPGQLDGITITNTLDFDASMALHTAEDLAAEHPTLGFPPRFAQYVTAPVFRDGIDLPASGLPSRSPLTAQEDDLFVRLTVMHGVLNGLTAPESVAAILDVVFELHRRHSVIVASATVDARRPGNRPAAPALVEIPAPATTMALRRAHQKHGEALTFPLRRRELPCHISADGRTHPAVRMVSHLGVTVGTCDDHQYAAANAAQALHNSLS